MTLQAWFSLGIIVTFAVCAVLEWHNRRWFDRKRAEWIASNDKLIAALRERTETNSQEGDEVR